MAREALLYDLQQSPACAKVRICLQVKGVPYRRTTPTITDILRDRPVPRLMLGERTLGSCDAIVRQLDVLWPEPPLAPREREARAYSDLLEGWADASLAGAVRRLAWGPEAERLRSARATASEVAAGPLAWLLAAVLARRAAHLECTVEDARARLREHLQVLDALLGDRPFLLGRTPTRADFAAFAQLACARRCGDELRLDPWPAVSAWLERLDAMPAIGTALAG
ncbi:MAG TPA: glutathione S-transferase family protein [Candidatus Limnocylindria bacterium]|nr:glutathione S-transferase family protein [Candidatus Limnocylindria bacterium]